MLKVDFKCMHFINMNLHNYDCREFEILFRFNDFVKIKQLLVLYKTKKKQLRKEPYCSWIQKFCHQCRS